MSDWDVQLISAGSLPMQGALLGPEGTFADTRICSNVVLLRGGGRTVLIDTAAGQLDSEWEGATSNLAEALAAPRVRAHRHRHRRPHAPRLRPLRRRAGRPGTACRRDEDRGRVGTRAPGRPQRPAGARGDRGAAGRGRRRRRGRARGADGRGSRPPRRPCMRRDRRERVAARVPRRRHPPHRATSSIPSGIASSTPTRRPASRRGGAGSAGCPERGWRAPPRTSTGGARSSRTGTDTAGSRPADARPRGRPGRGGPRDHRLDASHGWRRRPDRRGRGVRARRSRLARVPGHDRPERRDVRPGGEALRVPLLRDPLVRQRGLRASRASAPRCSSARSSRCTGSRPCGRGAGASRSRPARGTSARRSERHRRRTASPPCCIPRIASAGSRHRPGSASPRASSAPGGSSTPIRAR